MERSGRKLRSLNENEAHDVIVDLVSEIKLVTGSIVYQGDMLVAQLEMIKRFLLSGFSMLTKEELVEAFYMNLQGAFEEVYVHYNKELNAEFLGNVIRAYVRWKAVLLKENSKLLSVLLSPVKREINVIDYDIWKEMVQRDLMYLNGQEAQATLWHSRKYITLRRFGMMPFKGKSSWFYFVKKAIATGKYPLNLPPGSNINAYKFRNTEQVFKLFRTAQAFHICIEHARKFAYWYVLNVCHECGINSIWTEIKSDGNS